jgi:exopolysaccharide production protein ExoQ
MNTALQIRQYRAAPGMGEMFVVVIVLLLSMGAFQNLLASSINDGPNTGMLGMEIVWSLLYFVTLCLFFSNCDEPFQRIRSVFPLLAITMFVASSAFWSDDPFLTVRRSVALALTLVFGVYFASRFDTKRQLRLLVSAFGICVVFSFVFEIFGLNPDVGVPGWYGIFYQKNSLGRTMVLAALVFLFWKRIEPEHKWLARLGFVAAATLVLLARSATSLLILIFLVCILSYLRWSLRRRRLVAVAGLGALITAAVPLVFWASTHLEVVAGGLGRDPLLTGRVPLWILSTAAALQRPWLGFGYEAFWRPDEIYVRRIWHVLVWKAPHAHNGLLELWLDVGIIGLSLFLTVLIHYIARALKFSYLRRSDALALWPLMFLMFMVIGNLTEASFLSANSLTFILYVSAAFMLSNREKRSYLATAVIPEYA